MAIAKMNRVFLVGPSIHKEETVRFLQRAALFIWSRFNPLPVQARRGFRRAAASAQGRAG